MLTTKIYREIDPLDRRNVSDEFKGLPNKEIKRIVQERSLPIAVLMFNLIQDFNFSSVIRSANFLGAEKVFYFGEKRFDRRGAQGSYRYIDVCYLKSFKEFLGLKQEYSFVALEQNKNSVPLHKFNWPRDKKVLLLVGEEGNGVSEEIIQMCDACVEIIGRGSIRSLNAAAATTCALFDYVSKANQ